MKTNNLTKLVLLIAFIVMQQMVVVGQTFDFQNRVLDTNEVSNKNFTFTVNYINTFKYDVFIDNKPVQNNIEVPSILKTTIQSGLSSANFLIGNTSGIPKRFKESIDTLKYPKVSNLTDLDNIYLKLLTVEQFYEALNNLINSDISTVVLIKTKKDIFTQYISKQSSDDTLAVAKIIEYYSTISNIIQINAVVILGKDTTKIKEIGKIIEASNRINESKIIYRLASLYASINKETFTVSSFIKKPDADEVVINITAKSKSEYKDKIKDINIEIPIEVTGGWKIDYSTGMFVSNLIDNLYINKPEFRNDSIIGYKLIPENSNPLSYGFCGFMHAYKRSNSDCKLGLALGIGIDQNIQTKVMFGGSLMLGKKERFIINLGCSISKTKELSNIYYIDHLYKDRVDITYSEPFKTGWFLGISYNLSK
ncbi:MAG: hypothetical protein WCG08_15090 [Paludibacter sp.]